MAGEESNAGIPTKHGVVVTGNTVALGFFKQRQRRGNPFIGMVVRRPADSVVVSLGPALPGDARVVSAVIGRLQSGNHCESARKGAYILSYLLGQRQDQTDQSLLVGGLNLEDVAADAFGFARLIQQAVTLG